MRTLVLALLKQLFDPFLDSQRLGIDGATGKRAGTLGKSSRSCQTKRDSDNYGQPFD